MRVRGVDEEDGDRWDRFVRANPRATLCHLYQWKAVFEKSYRKRCLYLLAEQGGQTCGLLPLVLIRGLRGPRLVSLPFLDQGGILADRSRAFTALQQAALDWCRRLRARSLDLRGPSEAGAEATSAGDRYRLVLSLPDSVGALWKSIGPKVRNQIRKSEKSGLVTERVGPGRLNSFYRVFARNMRDLGSPVHSSRFFAAILSALGERASLYLTTAADGRVVAGAIGVRFRDSVTVPWASALRSARPSCPNHSLYWGILQEAVECGAAEFDFGRSTQGTGTFNFKKQWGAKPVALVWSSFDDQGRPQAARLLDARSHAPMAALWSHLPLGVANLVGPWIRRCLAN